jgi:hypothetical protein
MIRSASSPWITCRVFGSVSAHARCRARNASQTSQRVETSQRCNTLQCGAARSAMVQAHTGARKDKRR